MLWVMKWQARFRNVKSAVMIYRLSEDASDDLYQILIKRKQSYLKKLWSETSKN